MNEPLTTEKLRIWVVEARSPGKKQWDIYEPCTSESAASRSLRQAKKAWPEDEWRITVFVREQT